MPGYKWILDFPSGYLRDGSMDYLDTPTPGSASGMDVYMVDTRPKHVFAV